MKKYLGKNCAVAVTNLRRFNEMLNRAYPKYGENLALAIGFQDEED